MMSTKARCTRTGSRLAIGLGAVVRCCSSVQRALLASPATEAPPDGTYLVDFTDGLVYVVMTSSCGPSLRPHR